jgi:hypothetical protein
MKVRPFAIYHRYHYDPALIPEHGTPLFDSKTARPIPPTATVRIGSQFLTPKQIVYLLHCHDVRRCIQDPDANPNELVKLPQFILHKDGDQTNIRIENLQPSEVSRRWEGRRKMIDTSYGISIPREFLERLTPDQLEAVGVDVKEVLR